jgi:dihydropteroate synthase
MPAQPSLLDDRYPTRATTWHLRTRILRFGRLPLLMGIVNVTPDSFSDGGKFLDVQAAVDHSLRLLDDGADILDIGGESTRPYSTPVSAEEELARVVPVIQEVQRLRPDSIISIDTSKAAVAEAAIAAGAEIINDITGLGQPDRSPSARLKESSPDYETPPMVLSRSIARRLRASASASIRASVSASPTKTI